MKRNNDKFTIVFNSLLRCHICFSTRRYICKCPDFKVFLVDLPAVRQSFAEYFAEYFADLFDNRLVHRSSSQARLTMQARPLFCILFIYNYTNSWDLGAR